MSTLIEFAKISVAMTEKHLATMPDELLSKGITQSSILLLTKSDTGIESGAVLYILCKELLRREAAKVETQTVTE